MKIRKLIIVLGMHRGGTSAITRSLQTMGVHLGDKLNPAIEGNNDKGFWEDIDFVLLNIEILNALGSDWHYLAPAQQGDVELLQEKGYFLRAVELLRRKTEQNGVFGFKDPRVAKLLPFWKKVFAYCNYNVGYVIAIRHPLSVVKSLSRRDGFDTEKSHLLWMGHVLPSLSNTIGEDRVIVDYDRLMKSPSSEASRIAEHLGLIIDQKELQRYESEFLDEGLRHTVYGVSDLEIDKDCPSLVREIYAALLDVATDKTNLTDIHLQHNIEQWVEKFEFFTPSLMLADKLFTAVAFRDGQVAVLLDQVKNLEAYAKGKDAEVVRFLEQVRNLEAYAKGKDAEVVRFLDHVRNLEAYAKGNDAEAVRFQEQIHNFEAEVKDLKKDVQNRDVQLREYEQHIDRVEKTLQGIYQLKGWKLINTLYKFKAKLLSK